MKLEIKILGVNNNVFDSLKANLDEALRMNKIKQGDIVVFAGQGAGFSVGSIVMRWWILY